ncbi:hypothetical protein C2G38_2234135 [Gigaspora rosea]|uniref:Uncharacterized protein n=1 Tax=Gigaspora rosea TaxID=44941 RepID=A0A397TST6_9GLOM|nr:hypothetical protein C2G38_2234135 [Gigaspora rosea]
MGPANIYLPEFELAYTLKPNQYSIPDKYIVKTTCGKNEQTVICFINYIAKHPYYKIIFELEEEDLVCSILLSMAATNNYLKISKSTMNRVYLFGLQLWACYLLPTEHNLPRESAIFARKTELNNKISKIIPIHTVDLELLASQVKEFEDNIEVHFYNDKIVKEIESLLAKTVS